MQWPDYLEGRAKEVFPRLKKYLGVTRVDDWNDEPGRTKEQVVSALRGAARMPKITPGRSTLGLRKWFGFGIKA